MYKTEKVVLNPNDCLVLYTDGITEALNPHDEEFGEDRLLQTIKKSKQSSPHSVIDDILNSVVDFTHGYLQADDLTLVVLKVK